MPSRSSGGLSFKTRVVFNRFPSIQAHMLQAAEDLTAKAAMDMVAGMQMRAPVDTGFLRSSIQAAKVGPAYWRVTIGADYGLYVEFGTRFNRAQPFFFPTVAEVGPDFIAGMRGITG